MQVEEKRVDNSNKTGRSKSSDEFNEKDGYKPAGNMTHEGIKHQSKHQGNERYEGMKHEQHEGMKHEVHGPSGGKDHGNHHTHMLEDFRRRFVVSLILKIPVLLLSPTIQGFFGFELHVPGADFLTFLLSSVVYLYGGYPFLKGIKDELAGRSPGMMTLIAVAISVAYFYSSAVVFGLPGGVFF